MFISNRIGMAFLLMVGISSIEAFQTNPTFLSNSFSTFSSMTSISSSSSSPTNTNTNTETDTEAATYSFIDTDLRGAAMKLHTRKQAPKEGKAEAPTQAPYKTTHLDYLHYLVDSQHVFQALEDGVSSKSPLGVFESTGLERTVGLETDIEFMMEEYDLTRPEVGDGANAYAAVIANASDNSIPEFMCHYYNFYFAHTAGGRMIGKQMSGLLLNKKTLEFYKWDGDINAIKKTVKQNIEEMAATWSQDEKSQCVDATAAAFRGGGGINANLRGVH